MDKNKPINLDQTSDQAIREFNTKTVENENATNIEDGRIPKGKIRLRYLRRYIFLVAIATIVVAIGLIVGYYKFYLSPQRILAQSIYVMSRMDSVSYDGVLNFRAISPVNEAKGISRLNGLLSRDYTISFSGGTNLNSINNQGTDVSVSVKMDSLSIINLEALILGDLNFIKIKDVADLGLNDISKYNGQWIRIVPSEFNKLYGIKRNPRVSKQLTTEDVNKILKFAEKKPPIVITQRLSDVHIEGEDTYHYTFQIDKINLIEFYNELQSYSTKPHGLTGTYTQNLANILKVVNFTQGDLWISKKSLYVKKLHLSVKIDGIKKSDPTFGIDLTGTLKGFNKVMTISKPTKYVNFINIFNDGMYR